MDLFTLVGKIVLDADGFSEKIDSVMTKVESMGSGLQAAGDKISHMGTKLTVGVTAPIVGIGAAAIKTASDFESTMSQVAAISGATGSDFTKLENLAKEMGETTKFSASEAAEALTYMAMAGWKTDDMLNGLAGIMNLAAASGENLGTTSDIVTDALTAFGMSASDSGHFADVLAKASSNANTNVSMMGETFKYVAPVAGSLGYSAEDVALAIGLMANSGIKASQAGTSLRSSLTNLVKPTEEMMNVMISLGLATEETANFIDDGKLQKAQTKVENKTIDMEKAQIKYNEAVAKYGINSSQAQTAALNLEKTKNNLESAMYDLSVAQEGENKTTGIYNELLVDSSGNMKSFREVLTTLRGAFKGLSEEEQAQAAATLFGKEAMSGMLAIINASDSDFSKLAEAIDSADGAAKDMADTMNDNLSGQITLLKSQLEGLAIQFVTLIMPYLRQGVEWLSNLCTWIAGLDEGTKKMILTIAGIAAAAGPVLTIGGKVISAIGTLITVGAKLTGGIKTVITVGKTLLLGGTKVVGGIGSLTAKIGSGLLPALAAVPAPVWIIIGVISAVVAAGVALYKNWDTIKEKAHELKEKISEKWNQIKEKTHELVESVKEKWAGIKEGASEAIESVRAAAFEKWDQIKEKTHEFVESVKERYHAMADSLREKTEEMKTSVAEKYHEIKENAVSKFEEMKEQAGAKFAELKENATARIEELRVQAGEKIQNLKDSAVNHFEDLREKTAAKVSEMKEKVVTSFQSLKDEASAKISDLREKWGQRFEEAREKIVSEVTELKEKATAKIQEFKESAVEKVTQFKDSASGKFREFKEESVARLGEVAAKGVEGFNNIREKGSAAIESLKNTASNKFSEMGNAIYDKFSGISGKITDTFSKCQSAVHNIVEKIKGFFKFEWKLPDIKLPHFKIDGSFSLNPPSIPHIGVDWYAEGGVMMRPTAFGVNPASGNIMAGGEAGAEAIAPIAVLKDYIRDAVAERDAGMSSSLNAVLNVLNRYLPQLSNMQLVLDTGATVGALATGMNTKLGEISRQDERIR